MLHGSAEVLAFVIPNCAAAEGFNPSSTLSTAAALSSLEIPLKVLTLRVRVAFPASAAKPRRHARPESQRA